MSNNRIPRSAGAAPPKPEKPAPSGPQKLSEREVKDIMEYELHGGTHPNADHMGIIQVTESDEFELTFMYEDARIGRTNKRTRVLNLYIANPDWRRLSSSPHSPLLQPLADCCPIAHICNRCVGWSKWFQTKKTLWMKRRKDCHDDRCFVLLRWMYQSLILFLV